MGVKTIDNTCSCEEKDVNPQQPYNHNAWIKTWAWRWHRCEEFKTIIWPLTRAYCKITFHSLPTPKYGDIEVQWISNKAYTFKKLKDNI